MSYWPPNMKVDPIGEWPGALTPRRKPSSFNMTMRKGLPAKLAMTDADDTRYDLSGLIVCNADGSPRGGVLSPVGANIVTATATMNVSVARFQGAAVRDGGVVLLANDGPTNVPLDAAPAANSRIDVIWAKQNDASSTVSVPDASDLPVLGVLKGAASATPVRNPAGLPAGALELATVQIPSTATATNSPGVVITQTAQFTAGAGGLIPVRNRTELESITTLPLNTKSMILSSGLEYRFTGSTWVLHNQPRTFIRQRTAGGSAITWNAAATKQIGFATVIAADPSAFTVDGNNGTWTCARPGRYRFSAIFSGGGIATAGWANGRWRKVSGGVTTDGPVHHEAVGNSTYFTMDVWDIVEAAIGDTFEVWTQGSGAGLIAASAIPSFITIVDA